MTSVVRSRTIAASRDEIWPILADFGAIAEWVPMIQHSCLLSEQTEHPGTVRRVQVARQTLVERVVTWRPARELAYAIEGLPPIVGTARTTWRLATGSDGTVVTLTTVIETGPNPVRRLAATKVLERLSVAADFMLAGLATAVAPASEETS